MKTGLLVQILWIMFIVQMTEYTVVPFRLTDDLNIPVGGQVDFQVEALAGKLTQEYVPDERIWIAFSHVDVFTGEKSGWSNTQTFTYSENPQTYNEEPINDEVAPEEVTSPFVPEFTVMYVDYSYDTEPVYGFDEFTGKEVVTQNSRHVDERSIEFMIKNQAFESYTDSVGNEIGLYYNFRFKGHYGSEWSYYPFSENGQGTRKYSVLFYALTDESPRLAASSSEYTTIALTLPFLFVTQIPSIGSQADFQVQTLIGHIDAAGDGFFKFTGQSSNWSPTQTVTITQNPPTTPQQTIPEYPTWTILPIFIITTATGIAAKKRFFTK